METKAVYAGSFDPITLGHTWVIERAAEMFDTLTVAVGVNPLKKPTFSVEERSTMIWLTIPRYLTGHVNVGSFTNKFLINYAQEIHCTHIVRGLRNIDDFEFEKMMRQVNSDIDSEIQTVYLIPPRELIEVSSGAVKAMRGPEGWEEVAGKYVHPYVLEKLKGLP